MDRSHRSDTAAGDAQLDRLQASLHGLLDTDRHIEPPTDAPVDVRDYLLEPPPTVEQLEQRERLRRRVRIGSIAVAVVVGALLLVPAPSREDGAAVPPGAAGIDDGMAPNGAPSAPDAPAGHGDVVDRAPVRAQRLDAPAAAPAAVPQRRSSPAPSRPRPAPTTAATPAPTRPAVTKPAPTRPAPTAPTRPAPTTPTDGVLVPVM